MADGKTSVFANGGIATGPTNRTKLNIPAMRPNLTYLNDTGAILELVERDCDLAQNSIRHLAIRADGLVGFAMQWAGDNDAAPPFRGLHRRGWMPLLAKASLADELAIKGYVKSVVFDRAGRGIAIATRYDKTDCSYTASWNLAAALIASR